MNVGNNAILARNDGDMWIEGPQLASTSASADVINSGNLSVDGIVGINVMDVGEGNITNSGTITLAGRVGDTAAFKADSSMYISNSGEFTSNRALFEADFANLTNSGSLHVRGDIILNAEDSGLSLVNSGEIVVDGDIASALGG